MKITRVENGLAVELPDDLVKSLGLKPGDEVEIEVKKKPEAASESLDARTREEIIAGMRARARPLPEGYKFNRAEANGFEEE